MVLKCTSHLFALLRDAVSVPLRGYGFEIWQVVDLGGFSNGVSVPLRGYGFEIEFRF